MLAFRFQIQRLQSMGISDANGVRSSICSILQSALAAAPVHERQRHKVQNAKSLYLDEDGSHLSASKYETSLSIDLNMDANHHRDIHMLRWHRRDLSSCFLRDLEHHDPSVIAIMEYLFGYRALVPIS